MFLVCLFQAMALGTFHGLTAKGTTRQQENKKKPKNGKVGEKKKGWWCSENKTKSNSIQAQRNGVEMPKTIKRRTEVGEVGEV
jgi:hypothetical protein